MWSTATRGEEVQTEARPWVFAVRPGYDTREYRQTRPGGAGGVGV